MKINHKVAVHAYKFDGCLYRTFEFPRVIFENNKYIILDLQNCRIISQGKNKKFYHSFSKRDSLWVIFKDEWYNLFVTINDVNKIIYYFNIATPYIFEEDAIKYIDLDLDIRVVDVNSQIEFVKVLDTNEFEHNAYAMLYPKKLINKALEVKDDIILKLQNKDFQKIFNEELFAQLQPLLEIKRKNKNHEPRPK